jgi:hypothetical protein
MAKTVIFSIITIAVLIGFQQSYSIPEIDDEVVVGFEHGDAKAIPDWVRTTMGFYLKDQISEREILDTFNYLFENNIMHLSQEAAQEVQEMRNEINDLKQELEETKAAIAIPNLIEARKGANESSTSGTSGERIMQPEFGAGDNTQTKVIVRGWDPEQKESTTEANKESIQRFVVELYAESMSLSQDAIWLPMIEGEVLTGFEGDMDRPIIIGRIYNTESSQSYPIVPSQTKVLIMASTSDFDFASQTVDDVLRKGGTVSAWEDGIEAFKTDSVDRSAIPELQGIVVLCNIEIDKKIQRIDAELEIIEQWLEIISKEQESRSVDTSSRLASGDTAEYVQQYNQSDLDFIKRHLIHIDQQIKALDTGVEVFEEKLSSIGDDAQLANIDLQNALQKQQQTLQTISNVSKMHHDTMMSIINNMR